MPPPTLNYEEPLTQSSPLSPEAVSISGSGPPPNSATQPDGPGASTAATPALAPRPPALALRPLVASPGLGDGARALVDGDAEAGGLRLAQGHDGDVGAILAFHLLL